MELGWTAPPDWHPVGSIGLGVWSQGRSTEKLRAEPKHRKAESSIFISFPCQFEMLALFSIGARHYFQSVPGTVSAIASV